MTAANVLHYPDDGALVMGQSLERLYRARIDHHNHTLTAVRYQSLPPPVEGAEKERKKAVEWDARYGEQHTHQSNAVLLSACGSPGTTRVRSTGIPATVVTPV